MHGYKCDVQVGIGVGRACRLRAKAKDQFDFVAQVAQEGSFQHCDGSWYVQRHRRLRVIALRITAGRISGE